MTKSGISNWNLVTLGTTLQDESFFHLQLELSRRITGSFWRTAKAEKNEKRMLERDRRKPTCTKA